MKTQKKVNSYVTLEDGTDFRKIAQIMTDAGYRMNHATARNVLMSSLGNLIRHISEEIGSTLSDDQVCQILKDQEVHEALSDILTVAHSQLQVETQNKEQNNDQHHL